MEKIDSHIRSLAKSLEFKGYIDSFHINGIEQGRLDKVLTEYVAQNINNSSAFPFTASYYIHYVDDHEGYVKTSFLIGRADGLNFQVKQMTVADHYGDHEVIATRTISIRNEIDIPARHTLRDLVAQDLPGKKNNLKL